ncbi:probable aspartic proteinase GIP2 [Eucalyptus grandis]|uniref:probable aspartic proteinase GIP2 n=1 Tax=Eucalyptus grandis TaxID=71139 RepID=UPI00192E8D1D|nr:probable aspartic proteinase GIP2 [Eucalyptus grandis]
MQLVQALLLLALALAGSHVSAFPPYKTLVAPITKDTTTSLYTTTLNFHENYLVDLGAPFSWYSCQYKHPPVTCKAAPCMSARSYLSPLCPPSSSSSNNRCQNCITTPVNPLTKTCALSDLTYKNVALYVTNGGHPTSSITLNDIYMSCAPGYLLKSLPSGTTGLASLSWASLALSTQLTPPRLGITKKFAMCLPSVSNGKGTLFFGNGPYLFRSPALVDVSRYLSYTPLVKNPKSSDYYIGLNGISVAGKAVRFPRNAFSIDSFGRGGTKLSTVLPYTVLRSDVYDALSGSSRWPPSTFLKRESLQVASGKDWTISGANSMKQVSKDVACLAFVDGGKAAEQAVAIGSYQMEDNFLVFDLAQSTLGFSSSLLGYATTCANFDFTVKP